MRCRPFDDETRNALQALGFTISDDGEEAKIETEKRKRSRSGWTSRRCRRLGRQ